MEQNHVTVTLYTVSQKSEPPNHFATATANLHRFKWNFTHTRRHLFLSLTSNFIRIPYSVYEMFNSFKLLSQISVTDTTSSLYDRCQIRDVDHLKERLIEEWRRFDQNIIDRAVNQWRDRLCTRERGTLRTSDLNILTVLTDINYDGNSWLLGNVI